MQKDLHHLLVQRSYHWKPNVNLGVRHENITLNFQNFGSSNAGKLGTALREATNQVAVWLLGVGFNCEIHDDFNFFGGVHRGFLPPRAPFSPSE